MRARLVGVQDYNNWLLKNFSRLQESFAAQEGHVAAKDVPWNDAYTIYRWKDYCCAAYEKELGL